MAYVITNNTLGYPTIGSSSTTAKVPLGTEVDAYDPSLGAGRFIYLLGVASTVVGSVVKYNATTFQTALITNTANQAVPLAVAMSANLAASYDFYQIAGNAVIKKTAIQVLPQVPVFLSGTAGRVKVLASAGLEVLGARSANLTTVTTTTSTVTVTINRPFAQGQVT